MGITCRASAGGAAATGESGARVAFLRDAAKLHAGTSKFSAAACE